MGGGSTKETSISQPYYSPTRGPQAPPIGTTYTNEQIKKWTQDNDLWKLNNARTVKEMNDQYRQDNPLLALTDDATQLAKKGVYIIIGIAAGYLVIEGVKVYKTK